MIASRMRYALSCKVRAHHRVSRITSLAVDAWYATEVDSRRLDWIAGLMGDVAPAWRALDLIAARVEFRISQDYARFQFLVPGDRFGEPAILIPVWACDPGAWSGWSVIDLVAIDPRRPEGCWLATFSGLASALGEAAADVALDDGRPVRWYESALAWCRAGGDALMPYESDAPARFLPIDQASADRLLVRGGEIHAENDELGLALAARARELRRMMAPPSPNILVAEAA